MIRIMFVIIVGFLVSFSSQINGLTGWTGSGNIKPEKLFLTPLINSKQWSTNQVKERALVDMSRLTNDPGLKRRTSYSGYFTVNETFDSNLFFWFFPAKVGIHNVKVIAGAYLAQDLANCKSENVKEAPLILWLNGGPGSASLKGVFVENGPIRLNDEGHLIPREFSLATNFSVLYVDSPVGAGFSFTNHPDGRAKVLADVNRDLLSLLGQFFLVFPEFQSRDFHISGESYGGKYVPSLAMAVHNQNKLKNSDSKSTKINLKGFTIGSPYTHPPDQIEFGQFLYNVGLISSEAQKNEMVAEEAKIRLAITEERWADALNLLFALILNVPDCLYTKYSGFHDNANYLNPLPNPKIAQYIAYLNEADVRQEIHAGNDSFFDIDPNIVMDFVNIFFMSERSNLQKLLDLNYKVLLYSSQCDVLCPHPGLRKVVEELDWVHGPQFRQTDQKIWTVNDVVAGYAKRTNNLTFVHVLNAGHLAFVEQPQACLDMVSRFIKDEKF